MSVLYYVRWLIFYPLALMVFLKNHLERIEKDTVHHCSSCYEGQYFTLNETWRGNHGYFGLFLEGI